MDKIPHNTVNFTARMDLKGVHKNIKSMGKYLRKF